MSAEDYIPVDCYDPDLDVNADDTSAAEYGWGFYRPAVVTCRKCGTKSLSWQYIDGKWKLYKNGVQHVCRPPDKVFAFFRERYK